MRVESDEHIFKFVKAKFGFDIGRSVKKAKSHPLISRVIIGLDAKPL